MIGKTLAHYEITEMLGKGGMGEVYRARDTKLGRDVALKVLPSDLADDPERGARFEREARMLASLQHPNIASIYGYEEIDGLRFLTMELAEGEDLAQRLERGSLSIEECVQVAQQIAIGLEAAHETNIVHRDLKPANIKVDLNGTVKILDFGLARAYLGEGPEGAPLEHSPTITAAMTQAGIILGTAAYMSPEQAKGKAVNRRSDIWSFGVIVFEMLSGRQLFEGETVSETMAEVMKGEIQWSNLPDATPSWLVALLRRCLDRDPGTRLQSVGEARIALSNPVDDPPVLSEAQDGSPPRRSRTLGALAVVALLLGLALGRVSVRPMSPETPRVTFDVTIEDQRLRMGSLALSPDGRNLVTQVRLPDGSSELWIRPLQDRMARALPGTVGGMLPFWSPDSREVGFFANGQLLRLSLERTSPRIICSAPDALGGSWSQDDVILFGRLARGVHRVDAGGGEPVEITTVRADEEEHAWPVFLPDGDHFVFLADAQTTDAHRLYLSQLSSDESTVLKTGVRSSLAYDAHMGVVFAERRQLLAYALDVGRRQLSSESVLARETIIPLGRNHEAPFTISLNGIMASQRGTAGFRMMRTDITGDVLQQYGDVERFANPAVSPDGRRVLFEIQDSTDERLVWMLDLERGVRTPISQRNLLSDSGTWSADGETIYFDAEFDSTKTWLVYKKDTDGGGQPVQVGGPDGARETAVLECSSDGQWLLVYSVLSDDAIDLYLGRLDENGFVSEWLRWDDTPGAREEFGAFSPDAQFIAYTSDVSGRQEVYLAPVVGGPRRSRWQVSTQGGVEPRFSADGRFIHYRELNDRFMTVPVTHGDNEVQLGVPQAGFEAREPDIAYYRNSFDVFPDGSLLVVRPTDDSGAIVVVDTAWRP